MRYVSESAVLKNYCAAEAKAVAVEFFGERLVKFLTRRK